MKRVFTLVVLLWQVNLQAQTKTVDHIFFEEGRGYLTGITKSYDPKKAKELLLKSAALNNAQAMNFLGSIYLSGIGTKKNADSAIYWYKASAINGNGKAYYNLGNMYRQGILVLQNFVTAAKYFLQGAALKNDNSTYLLAYMYYKGLGIKQSYQEAFMLFKQLAEKGNASSMYFLGLCYRNGYGITTDNELASQWLKKAAALNNYQAKQELEEALPENVSVVTFALLAQLEEIVSFKEKFIASNNNNYEGSYTGYAIYYDWSGKFVSEMQPLKLILKKNGNFYEGDWQEGLYQSAPIKLNCSSNLFSFDTRSNYSRTNHYSSRQPENWKFNQASLDMGFVNDSIQLTGFVQFYSSVRKEPGKPLQIVLKKAIEEDKEYNSKTKLSLFPNPANSATTVQFTLQQSARVIVKITAVNGTTLYQERDKKLPAGTYNYKIALDKFTAGTYLLELIVNGKLENTKTFVKL